MSTCTATWSGGSCERDANATPALCAGHYMQQRRKPGAPFAPLRLPHGADTRGLEPLTLHIPKADLDTLRAEATRRGVPTAEVYRDALWAYAENLRRTAAGRVRKPRRA